MSPKCVPYLPTYSFMSMRRSSYSGSLKQTKHLALQLTFTYRCINDILSLINSKISEFIDIIYPCEVEIKDTAKTSINCYLYIRYEKLDTRRN